MGRPRLDAAPGMDPRIVKQRPSDQVTIFGHSTFGAPHQPQVLNRPERQNFTQMVRVPDRFSDTLIKRTRMYVYRNPNTIPAGISAGNINWTDSGPPKSIPTMRFNRNVRPLVGGAHSNMNGQHTNIISGQAAGNQLTGKSRMKAAGQNRLTVQRYRGQSYSATTVTVGH